MLPIIWPAFFSTEKPAGQQEAFLDRKAAVVDENYVFSFQC